MNSPFSGIPAMAGDQKRLELIRGKKRGLVAQILQAYVVQVVYSLHRRHQPALRHVHRGGEHLCPARINLCVSPSSTPTRLRGLSCHSHRLPLIDRWSTRFNSVACPQVPSPLPNSKQGGKAPWWTACARTRRRAPDRRRRPRAARSGSSASAADPSGRAAGSKTPSPGVAPRHTPKAVSERADATEYTAGLMLT
jgi:hypothetical protein